jgi:PAS domain S-box-containing protein
MDGLELHGGKILIVEDESLIAIRTSLILKEHGYTALTAPSGESAVEKVKKEDISLILMDMDLGEGIDGAETARRILAFRDVPIVFLSSHTEEEIIRRTRDIISYGYVVKSSGETVLITTINMVLKLHKAHTELEETKEYLDKIINSLVDPVFVKDRDHRWVLVNDALCRFSGLSREELIGKHDFDVFPPEEAEVFWEKDNLVLERGEENVNEELFTDSTGVVHTVVTKKALYTDKRGNRLVVGVIRDVTTEKNALTELEEAYKEKDALLKELQHRVKNSFAILTSLLRFEIEASDNERRSAILRRVENRINSIADLYLILGLSENIRSINVGEYLQRITNNLDQSFSNDGSTGHILFDADEIITDTKLAMSLGLMVNELVTNAFKYAPESNGGEGISVSVTREADQVVLRVSNTGNSFPADFDMETSAGLGLKLVQMLTAQHQGTVKLEAEKDSLFTIRLPVN